MGNVTYHVGDLIDGLHDKLTQQIARAIRHDAGVTHECETETDFEAMAQTMAIQFLERIPELRILLATDVDAAFSGDPSVHTVDEVIFCYPGLEAVPIYRLAHEMYLLEIPFIPRMLTEWAHAQTGIDIHPGDRLISACQML